MASEPNLRRDNRRPDGFTLVELLIVVVIMGTLMTVLSAVIITALRTTPPTQARVDDARGLQGLVTWLPQDVDATPPGGFNRDPSAWPCAAPAPSTSYNLLAMEWTEQTTTTASFAASYRYEKSGERWTIVRYYCALGGPSTRYNLTSDLQSWDTANPPAKTVLCSVVVDALYSGVCPSPYLDSDYTPDPVRSLKLIVSIAGGDDVVIDAAPKNPDETLADDPDAAANQPPTVQNTAFNITVPANSTNVIDLAPLFGTVNDPDGPAPDPVAPLSVSIDPIEPFPTNLLSASTAYTATTQFELTLTSGPTPGTAGNPLVLIVSDDRGGWRVVEATIIVSDPLNVAPWLVAPDPTTRAISLPSNAGTITLDPVTLFNVQDDAPLTELRSALTGVGAVPGVPPADPLNFAVTAVPGSSDLEVTFNDDTQVSLGGVIEVDFTLTDAGGNAGPFSLPLHLTITLLSPSNNVGPVATVATDIARSIEAGSSLTVDVTAGSDHGVTDSNLGDILRATVENPVPSGITATFADTVVTITVPSSAAPGPLSGPVRVRVHDLHGLFVDVTVTVTVTTPPPPLSNCVLGSLTASPNSVARQGGGGGAKKLTENVTVTLTYTGTCDGLRLSYDSGDPTGLGTGVGRTFPPGSPTQIVIVGNGSGGVEQFTAGNKVLTASTTSAVAITSVTTNISVT